MAYIIRIGMVVYIILLAVATRYISMPPRPTGMNARDYTVGEGARITAWITCRRC